MPTGGEVEAREGVTMTRGGAKVGRVAAGGGLKTAEGVEGGGGV